LSTALFGKNIEPACKYCEYAMQELPSTGQILCSKLGVVAAGYRCKRYEYDPTKRIPRPIELRFDYSAEDFSIE
jgi:hypothetical protein